MAAPFLPSAAELLREHIERLRPEVDWTVELWEGSLHGSVGSDGLPRWVRLSLVRGGRLWAWEADDAVVLGIGEPNPTEPLFALMARASDEEKARALQGELPWWRVDGSVRLADPGVWARWVPLARPPIASLVHQGAVVGDRRIRIPCGARVFPDDVDLLVAFALLEHWHPVDGAPPAWAPAPPDSDKAAVEAWLRSLRGRRQVASTSEVEPWRRALQDEELARADLLARLGGMPEPLRARLARRAVASRCTDVLLQLPLSVSVVHAWSRQAFDRMLVGRLAEVDDPRLWAVWLVGVWGQDRRRTRGALEAVGVDMGSPEVLEALEGALLNPCTSELEGLGPWLLARAHPTHPGAREALARVLLALPWEGTSIVAATHLVGEEVVASVLLWNLRAGSELEMHDGETRLTVHQARALTQLHADSDALRILLRHAPEVAPWLRVADATASVQIQCIRAVASTGPGAEPALLDLLEQTDHQDVRLEAVALLGQVGGAKAYRALQAYASQWFLPRDLARAYRTALAQIQDRTRSGALSLVEERDGALSLTKDPH